MKFKLVLCFGFVFLACTDKSLEKKAFPIVAMKSVEELEKEGFKMFQTSPKKALPVFKKIALKHQQLNRLDKTAIAHLNVANIYDEHLNELDSALIYSNKSLQLWREINDTLQIANLYKYIGLLEGKLDRFQDAKKSIYQAIDLYMDKSFKEGVAVSKINLADVYFREKKYNKSETLFLESKLFWNAIGNKRRVFTDNILGVKIYRKIDEPTKVESLILENKAIGNEIQLNPFVKTSFEKLLLEN